MRAGCKETIALTENLVKVVDVMQQRLQYRGALARAAAPVPVGSAQADATCGEQRALMATSRTTTACVSTLAPFHVRPLAPSSPRLPAPDASVSGGACAETVGNAITDRQSTDTISRHHFVAPSLRFSGNGKVLSWDIYAGRTGALNLQVWRAQKGSTDTYDLVCENAYNIQGKANRKIHFDVTPAEQCTFLSGDVIGWFHSGPGVIKYDPKTKASSAIATVLKKYVLSFGRALTLL